MCHNPPARSVSLRHILPSRFFSLSACVVGNLRTLPRASMPKWGADTLVLWTQSNLRHRLHLPQGQPVFSWATRTKGASLIMTGFGAPIQWVHGLGVYLHHALSVRLWLWSIVHGCYIMRLGAQSRHACPQYLRMLCFVNGILHAKYSLHESLVFQYSQEYNLGNILCSCDPASTWFLNCHPHYGSCERMSPSVKRRVVLDCTMVIPNECYILPNLCRWVHHASQ